MRISEDRIGAIAHKIAFHLVRKRMIITREKLQQVTAWAEKPILEDIRLEEVIDNEVREFIQGASKRPPEGSFEWQAMYDQKKEEIARRHNYTV